MKVKATKINLFAVKLGKKGGVCMTSDMVRKLNQPREMFVEVNSLINWLRYINRNYVGDDFHEKEINSEFINIIEGSLKEKANMEDIEWI
jgi:hypothetical protein